ncbi:MAG: hypothetical protein HUJ68_04850 [Clostridia bacterium]|nr:hypothetical protein [Clostridia bacterium]
MQFYDSVCDYLIKVSGVREILGETRIISDLHLNSKEIIDFAIFIFNISGIKIEFGKDLSVKMILDLLSKEN